MPDGMSEDTLLVSGNTTDDITKAVWSEGNTVVYQGAHKAPQGRGEQISRQLSSTLRHQAHNEGLKMDPDGYVSVPRLLRSPKYERFQPPIKVEELFFLVQYNEKKRFGMTEKNGEHMIRAYQGHTVEYVDQEKLQTAVKDPSEIPVALHGTFFVVWKDILSQGLKTMGRQQIHFADKRPESGEVISGMRTDCQIIVEIDTVKAMNAGIKFFRSENQVILTPGDNLGILGPQFFKRVTSRADGRQVWPKVAESGSTGSSGLPAAGDNDKSQGRWGRTCPGAKEDRGDHRDRHIAGGKSRSRSRRHRGGGRTGFEGSHDEKMATHGAGGRGAGIFE